MDQDEHAPFDPLAPPPTQTHHAHDSDYYPYDGGEQTVPNMESGVDMGYQHPQQQYGVEDEDPRNFHDDLPANFAKEAAIPKNEFNNQNQYYDGDGYDQNPYHHQGGGDFQQQMDDHDGTGQEYSPRSHDQVDYDDSSQGTDVLESSGSTNPFNQSDGLSGGQKVNEFEDDRPILGGYVHQYDGREEATGVGQQQEPAYEEEDTGALLAHRHQEQEEEESDEEEGLGRDEFVGEQRSNDVLPEQQQYGASPPESDRFRDQELQQQTVPDMRLHDDDVAESQRVDEEDYNMGQSQGRDESSQSVPASGDVGYDSEGDGGDMPIVPGSQQKEEDDSDTDQNAGNFEYNKMEEEDSSTPKGVGGGFEGEEEGQNLSEAGFDNHAFDDNDDEASEVIERKVEETNDDMEMTMEEYNKISGMPTVCEPCNPQDNYEGGVQQPPESFDDQPIQQHSNIEDDRYQQESGDDQLAGNSGPESQDYYRGTSEEEEIQCVQQSDRLETTPGHGIPVITHNPAEDDISDEENENTESGRFESDLEKVNQTGVDEHEKIATEDVYDGHNPYADQEPEGYEQPGDRFEKEEDDYQKDEDDDDEQYKVESEQPPQQPIHAEAGGFEEGKEEKMITGYEKEDEYGDNENMEFDNNDDNKENEAERAVAPGAVQMEDKLDMNIDMEDKDSNIIAGGESPRDQPCYDDDSGDYNGEEKAQDAAPLQKEDLSDDDEGFEQKEKSDLFTSGKELAEAEKQQPQVDVYDDGSVEQLVGDTDQSPAEFENTPPQHPSHFEGDFESSATFQKDGGKRSFVDMIGDNMASPETIPQPLPSPPQPENMMSQFDPLAPASASSSPSPDDDQDELIMDKQQQSSNIVDGMYYDNHVSSDTREESSEDLCLRAGEIEGETKFGVDGSVAVTTSSAADDINDVNSAFMTSGPDDDFNQAQPQSLGFESQPPQQHQQLMDDNLESYDEEDDAVNTGQATDHTTTTETATEENSGADFDSSSIGAQPGFEQGGDNDNALMSMSMEGSFYDDGGELMGGSDGINGGGAESNNLLIQSAITEVSEPTSSFSPHQDSLLRSEQQAFEEKLQEQNDSGEEQHRDIDDLPATHIQDAFGHPAAERDDDVGVQTTHESFAPIPSGFEDSNATPVQQVDHSSEPMILNGSASDCFGVPVMDAGFQPTPAMDTTSGAPADSSSSVDTFGLQNNQCILGGGSGFEESSSVDNVGIMDMDNNSSAVNGHFDNNSVIPNEVGSPALEPIMGEQQPKVDDAENAFSSAATVSETEAAPASLVSTSVDAAAPAVAAVAETKTEDATKDKDKKDTVKKDKEKDKKPGATTKPTSLAKKTTTTPTARKTTPTASSAKTTTSTTTKSARPSSARPASAKTPATTTTPKSTASPRKPASAPASAAKTSPTKTSATSPSAASKPLPRYAQPITPRKPRDSSANASPANGTARKPATSRPATAPTSTSTTRARPAASTTPRSTSAATTKTTSTTRTSTTTSTSSPRPKSSPTKLSNGTTPSTTDKRSTSPTKKYGVNASPRTPASSAAKTTEKKDAKPSTPRTGAIPTARSPTKTSSPRTPSNSASSPRTGSATAKSGVVSTKKPDYSNVTSRIGSKDKITHKPGGGNVKIESHKLKVEAKSRIGSLDNASHKPAGGDKKVENGAGGGESGSPV